uniref:Fucolectin tachylectin-4 pentraxin-1 domain-containing protein n=1 Tax=Cyprinus carpio TaxID=7962 RepID=A0A8C1LIT8_CYPCA
MTDPWWRVDLLNEYNVYRVAITNRDDYALNGAVIRVGNFPNNVYTTANFSCKGIEGRYVIVHIPGELKTLTLCEVEVYGYLLVWVGLGKIWLNCTLKNKGALQRH